MEVTQTQRNSLPDNAEGRRSETIILHRLYSPNRLATELKYYESNGVKDIGTVILGLLECMEKLDIMKLKMQRLKTERVCNMNYHNITHDDMLNGSGLRVVLWCSGCEHHCNNCQNPQTWDFESGIPFDKNSKNEIFNELKKDYISGITYSGGDPLAAENLEAILSLTKEIRISFPEKTIWCYSGYTWNQIMYPVVTDDFNPERDKIIKMRQDIVKNCDVLIDGKYIDELRDVSLHWRGSSNQRVIDVQKSLKDNSVVLYEE